MLTAFVLRYQVFHEESQLAEKTLTVDLFQRVLQFLLADKDLGRGEAPQQGLSSLEAAGLSSREQVRELGQTL